MGKKYRIIFNRDICIGDLSCTQASKNWVVADDGRPNPQKIIVDESELAAEMEALRVCPVEGCIKIEEIKEGEE